MQMTGWLHYFAAIGPRGETTATVGPTMLSPSDASERRADFQEAYWGARIFIWRWDGSRWIAT